MNGITDICIIIYFFTLRFLNEFIQEYVEPRMTFEQGINNQ